MLLHRYLSIALPSRLRWQFYCDSKGLLKRLERTRTQCHRVSDLTRSDADMCQCALLGLQRLGITTLHHVKGHQDRNSSVLLSEEAQMNVAADTLATAQLQHGRPSGIAPFFPGYPIQLFIGKTHITSHLDRRIQYAVTTPNLRRYMTDAYQWQSGTADLICWEVHGRALKTLSDKQRLFATKLIHGWLPSGARSNLYDSTISPACPYCGCPSETQAHFLQCRHSVPVEQWALFHTTLQLLLRRLRTEPSLQGIILFQLSALTTQSVPPPILFEASRTYLRDQREIGWHQLLYGRLADSMITFQDSYLRRLPDHNHRLTGVTWGKRLVVCIWHHLHTLWLLRCTQKYGDTLSAQLESSKAQLLRQLEQLYASRHLLPHQDQQLFPTIQEMRLKRVATLRSWINIIEPLIHHHRKRPAPSPSQTLLTNYYEKPTAP